MGSLTLKGTEIMNLSPLLLLFINHSKQHSKPYITVIFWPHNQVLYISLRRKNSNPLVVSINGISLINMVFKILHPICFIV